MLFRSYQTAGIRQNSILFAPLLAMSILSPKYLLWKFCLSIVFPGLVWLLFFRGVWADRRMVLAWLVFDCGAAWCYLAAEKVGPGDGNFTWGVQMALFILFLESILFIARRLGEGWPVSRVGRAWLAGSVALCSVAFVAHIVFGVIYNARILKMIVDNKPFAWW